MMNNKKLAIVLSIVAVIVVFYQIFLRKDDDATPNRQNPKFVKTNIKRVHRTTPSMANKTGNEATDNIENLPNNMIIDLYSPQLLKRIKPYIDNSMIELEDNFGENIFGFKTKKIKEENKIKKTQKIPVLNLNGIIEIIKDKIIVAIINNRLYNKGEMVENAKIEKIEKYRVFLKFNTETIILSINQGSYRGWIRKKAGGNS